MNVFCGRRQQARLGVQTGNFCGKHAGLRPAGAIRCGNPPGAQISVAVDQQLHVHGPLARPKQVGITQGAPKFAVGARNRGGVFDDRKG